VESKEGRLLVEQMCQLLEQLHGRMNSLEARISHMEELLELRLSSLESIQSDQETRLRGAAEAVTRLSASSSLAQRVQAAFALVLSALAAWLGSR
jgi:uncharacterized coiled-coil protein SlyX